TGTPHDLCHVRALREGRFYGVFIDGSTQSPDMKFRPDLLTIRLCCETDEVVLSGLWQNDIIDGTEWDFGHRKGNTGLDIRLARVAKQIADPHILRGEIKLLCLHRDICANGELKAATAKRCRGIISKDRRKG